MLGLGGPELIVIIILGVVIIIIVRLFTGVKRGNDVDATDLALIICDKCKKSNSAAAKFCVKCGARVSPIKSDLPRQAVQPIKRRNQKYSSYDEVPYYRKEWFFWLSFLLCFPLAMGILIFGDVYYQKKGELKSFGWANRIVAALPILLSPFVLIAAIILPIINGDACAKAVTSKDYNKAIGVCSQYIDKNGKGKGLAFNYYCRGASYQGLGDGNKALSDYNRAQTIGGLEGEIGKDIYLQSIQIAFQSEKEGLNSLNAILSDPNLDYATASQRLAAQVLPIFADIKSKIEGIRPPENENAKEHYSMALTIVTVKHNALLKMIQAANVSSGDDFKSAVNEFSKADDKLIEFNEKVKTASKQQ